MDVQAGPQADGIVEGESEDFSLQAEGTVVVDPPADGPPEGDFFDEFEVPEGYLGGPFDLGVAYERLDDYIIQSHNRTNIRIIWHITASRSTIPVSLPLPGHCRPATATVQ